MLKTMLRDLLSHKGRLTMTLLAIALGVAATVASWIVSDSVASTLAGTQTRTNVDVSVQSIGNRPTLSGEDSGRLAALPGVQHTNEVLVGRAGLVGPDGKLVATQTVLDHAGTNWDGTGRFSLVAGRAPAGPEEVAVGRVEAGKAHLELGDRVRVLLADGQSHDSTVSGLFSYVTLGPAEGEAADAVPAVAYDQATAQQLLGSHFSRVELVTAPGVDATAVKKAARHIVGTDGYLMSTGTELAAMATQEAGNAAQGCG